MLKVIITVLVIFPWSLVFGMAYLAYRRVRSQRRAAKEFLAATRITEPISEKRKKWMAECVAQSKASEYPALGRGTAEEIADFYFDGVPEPQVCTRPLPHACKVNGPCNGYPKEDLMQQKPLDGWKTVDANHVTKMGRA